MVRYWLKLIREGDPWLSDKKEATGMSWGSIKKVRTVSDKGKNFSSINVFKEISVGDPVIIKVEKTNSLKAGTYTQIKWGETMGAEWKDLGGNDWENFFWIEDAKTIGTFEWARHKDNLQFLRNFNKVGYAFMTGMWELPERDYHYIIDNAQ